MDNPFSNIDQGFKDAFEHWEADYTPSEMHAQWKQVSQQVPTNMPHSTQTIKHLLRGSKLMTVAGAGVAITTIGILLYNIYVKPVNGKMSNQEKALASQSVLTKNADNAASIQAPALSNSEGNIGAKETTNARVYKTDKNSKGPDALINPAIVNLMPYINGLILNNTPEPKVSPVQTGNNLNFDFSTRNNNSAINRPRLIFSDTVVCVGSGLSLHAANRTVFDGSVIDWGEGNSTAYYDNIWHVYATPGLYHVKVKNGQVNEDKTIQVLGTPKAAFSSNVKEDLVCEFNSQALNTANVIWDFGDGTPLEQGTYVRHRYNDTCNPTVKMIAANGGACADTSIVQLKVRRLKDPALFNIFTPDGNGSEDDYFIDIDNETYYELTITDKQGAIVFHSTDKSQHWNGTVNNNGAPCPTAWYSLKLVYKLVGQNIVKNKIANIKLER